MSLSIFLIFNREVLPSHLDIADLRSLRAETCGLAGDGEERGHPQRHSPRHVLHVHPEADPGHDDDEDGGDVGLDQVEPDAPVQLELGGQAAVVS